LGYNLADIEPDDTPMTELLIKYEADHKGRRIMPASKSVREWARTLTDAKGGSVFEINGWLIATDLLDNAVFVKGVTRVIQQGDRLGAKCTAPVIAAFAFNPTEGKCGSFLFESKEKPIRFQLRHQGENTLTKPSKVSSQPTCSAPASF
jgi:hypothetical protein